MKSLEIKTHRRADELNKLRISKVDDEIDEIVLKTANFEMGRIGEERIWIEIGPLHIDLSAKGKISVSAEVEEE